MDFGKIIDSLHPLEREILPVLEKHNSLEGIITVTNLKSTAVLRAVRWLEKKELVQIIEKEHRTVRLDVNGKKYLSEGLPERNLLECIEKHEQPISQIKKDTKLTNEEINVAIGKLRARNAIFITKEKKIKILDAGKGLLAQGFPEEAFLQKSFPLPQSEIKEKKIFEHLKKRKNLLKIDNIKTQSITLTDIGQKLLASGIKISDMIDGLTSSILQSGSWKGEKFRRFDITSNVPSLFPGKKQHYRKFLDEVRVKFLSLGFEEMTGPLVETNFWNMDALFMPQFHSARDIHDAYYIKEPSHGKVDQKIVQRVKAAHEHGFSTGSKGWGYEFDTKFTLRHLLRTQTTACSARMLASPELKIPGKYFAIARCFRYDVVDSTHLADFNQTEGIVVGEEITFRHLIGLLKLIAEEFAETDQVKITPGYFPFTEPSAELHAKHPDLGWIELAGSGLFRPELCKPLGVDVPVIAWGIGIDRLAMFKLGLKDIRELFSHNLDVLRGAKVV